MWNCGKEWIKSIKASDFKWIQSKNVSKSQISSRNRCFAAINWNNKYNNHNHIERIDRSNARASSKHKFKYPRAKRKWSATEQNTLEQSVARFTGRGAGQSNATTKSLHIPTEHSNAFSDAGINATDAWFLLWRSNRTQWREFERHWH